MFKSKYLVVFLIASLVFLGGYATTKLSLNITSKTTKELSFSISGGVQPYQITVAGEKYKINKFKGTDVRIKSPLPGKYLILARDSKGAVANFEIIIEN